MPKSPPASQSITTMAALQERFAHDVAHAESTLLTDGHVAPLFALTGADGTVVPLLGDFSDAAAKARSIDLARMLAVATDALMAMHRAEAWLVMGDLPAGVLPGQSDRRLEALIVVLTGRIGKRIRCLSSVREIVRGPDGKPCGLKELGLPAAGSTDLGGPMTELLPPKRPSAEMRVLASAMLDRMGVGTQPPT